MSGKPVAVADSADTETLRVYDRKAAEYARLTGGARPPALARFIAMLPPGAHVLDLGCGPGHDALAMQKAGLRVDAVDGSAEMVRLARAAGVPARQALFEDIDGTDIYAGIWASFSLLHAPRRAFPGHLARLRRALKTGGVLALGMKRGTGEGRDRLGRAYCYYEAEELAGLLQAAGLEVIDSETGAEVGLAGGAPEPWIVVFARG